MRLQHCAAYVGFGVAGCALLATGCAKSPTAPQNGPPTVTVAFDGSASCILPTGASCTLPVVATARDPEGDPLRYRWSGCASGDAARATCTVERAGHVTASVEVSDDHGHAVTASVTGEGAVMPNSPPAVAVLFEGPSTCAPEGSRPCVLTVRAQATDPDGDPLTYSWSGCASGAAPQATCTVAQLGPVVAQVEVSDDHDHTVTASLSGAGVQKPNQPPAVVVRFEGPSHCTPSPDRPCTLDVRADAVDPDGDALSYSWSGCASGTAARATCVVSRPGPEMASVDVSDGENAPARAVAVALGDNRPPDVQIGSITLYPSGSIEILGNVQDPDEGFICGRRYCGVAAATGACANVTVECTCLAGLEAFLVRTSGSGICTVTFSLKDSWEQVGSPAISFDVSNPQAWWRRN